MSEVVAICGRGEFPEDLVFEIREDSTVYVHRKGERSLSILEYVTGESKLDTIKRQLNYSQTSDPYGWTVNNGSVYVHDFDGDTAFTREDEVGGWGYYLPHPWPGWVTGFSTKEEAACAAIDAIFNETH